MRVLFYIQNSVNTTWHFFFKNQSDAENKLKKKNDYIPKIWPSAVQKKKKQKHKDFTPSWGKSKVNDLAFCAHLKSRCWKIFIIDIQQYLWKVAAVVR